MNNNYNNQQMSNQNMNYGYQQQNPNQGMNFGGQNVTPTGNSFLEKIPKDTTSIIGYAGAAIAMIGCFCPFSTVEVLGMKESVSYFSNNGDLADGAIVLIFMIATLVLLLLRKNVIAIATTVIGALIYLNNVLKFSDLKGDYGSFAEVKTGAAVFLVGIGLAALVVHFVLYIKNNPKCFSDFFNKHTKPMFQNQNMGPMPYPNNQPMNQNQNMNYGQPNQNNQYPNNNNNNVF